MKANNVLTMFAHTRSENLFPALEPDMAIILHVIYEVFDAH